MVVRTETNGAVARVILARPEVHNAFNAEMIAALKDAFTELGGRSDVRVIVLAAEGGSFCAGADLNWMQSMVNASYDANKADAKQLAEMLRTIAECPKPVIGRIHGHTFGGGVGLISVCDIAVAVEKATLCLSEVKLGLLPAVISPFVLRKLPVAQAHRYFLTAERFSAAQALQFGLVSEVVADEAALDSAIEGITKALLQAAPEAVGICKQMIPDIAGAGLLNRALDHAISLIAERRVSAEGQEGMHAFLEKRPAAWTVAADA